MAKSYDEQAKFLADKLKEATLIELKTAASEGRLHWLKEESIEDLAEIIYLYYKEFNRPFESGLESADINDIIRVVFNLYIDIKKHPYDYMIPEGKKFSDEWEKFIKECRAVFAKNVLGIDLKLQNKRLEDCNYAPIVVENPKFQFAYVANSGGFAMGYENDKGIPVRFQYMDEFGRILDQPIETYYDSGYWFPANSDSKTTKKY